MNVHNAYTECQSSIYNGTGDNVINMNRYKDSSPDEPICVVVKIIDIVPRKNLFSTIMIVLFLRGRTQ